MQPKAGLASGVAESEDHYSVEYFHIYTDEKISHTHKASLNYLKAAQSVWTFPAEYIVLIDNYNPTEHTLESKEVFKFLEDGGLKPEFWAFEADFVNNAEVLLENVTSKKLQRNYRRYIESRNKYPCSLLTAAWYLTRLGKLDSTVIRSLQGMPYRPADRLINILPEAYRPVELRAQELILHSTFVESAHRIQDLFFASDAHRKLDLF